VAIGASAGGLEALQTFFQHMPPDSGAAFVVIQHLAPDYKSLLPEMIQATNAMETRQATDGKRVEPNKVYTIQPGKEMLIADGVLKVVEAEQPRGRRMPIDIFFASLAQDRQENAICVLLSGTGSDGTLSLKTVKECGGITLAQHPGARYDGMPMSAISTGLVDMVLSVEEMPGKILDLIRNRPTAAVAAALTGQTDLMNQTGRTEKNTQAIKKILRLLKLKTGHDFSLYKHNTIARRVARRMVILQIREVHQYLKHIQDNSQELWILLQEMLIGVTSFFRDPASFDVLVTTVIPQIFAGKEEGGDVRVWVPGCSTGEEAYTVAMVLAEYMEKTGKSRKIKVFATDIDLEALDVARRAFYPHSIEASLSRERLDRYFVKEANGYTVVKSLREMVVFAPHSLIKDPPFSHLDLISCRNLLIYLGPDLQNRVLPLFHYALNPNGFLCLGPSESVSEYAYLFTPVDKKWKIFQRKTVVSPGVSGFSSFNSAAQLQAATVEKPASPPDREAYSRQARELILNQYAQPSVIVNERLEPLQFFGQVERYFTVSAGEFTKSVLDLARRDVRLHLKMALRSVFHDNAPLRRDGLTAHVDARLQEFNLVVTPLKDDPKAGRLALAVFEHVCWGRPQEDGPRPVLAPDAGAIIVGLEQELQTTRAELQTTIEELETSREELHSINEELVTVNAELQSKIAELDQVNSDLVNLMNSNRIATMFLDKNLNLRFFTPQLSEYFNILAVDIGRPFDHFRPKIEYPEILADLRQVLTDLMPVERRISTEGEQQLVARITPYRSLGDTIEGVVLTLVDVTHLVFTESQLALRSRELENLYKATPDICLRISTENRILGHRNMVGAGFLRQDEPLEGKHLREVLPGEMAEEIEETLAKVGTPGFQERMTLRVNADDALYVLEVRVIGGQSESYVLMRDITELSLAEERIRFQAEALSQVNDAIVATNEAGEITLWNPGAEKILGIPAGDALGRGVREILGVGWEEVYQRDCREDTPGTTPSEHREMVYFRPDGGEIALEPSVSFLRNRGGKMFGCLMVLRDVTERLRYEQELLRARAEAEKANSAKSEFLTNMSHEIRTPMNGVLGLTGLILASEDISPTVREYLQLVNQSGLDLLAIINDILDLAKIESGKVELERKEFDLRAVLESSLASFAATAEHKMVEIVHNVSADVPDSLVGDPGRLRQIIVNLVGNAVKFTPKGRVTVTVEPQETAGPGLIRLLFRVADTGIGIPAEHLQRIFENFAQVKSSAHAQYGGTGLGLSIVTNLVELMGGEIQVESQVGKGSTFLFTAVFESAQEGTRPETAAQPAAPRRAGNLSILLAEDDAVNRVFLIKLLKDRGHQVEVAENGREALEKLKAGFFDLVLMDERMPEMDGSETVRAIRQGDAGPDKAGVMVVALTAQALSGDRERFLDAGMDDYLTKPVDFDAFDRVLERAAATRSVQPPGS
jgi:two-component system CheB/CheR fusion protein